MSFIRRFSVFLLALAMLLFAVSCTADKYPELRKYRDALSEAPATAVLTSTLESELGTLKAEYTVLWSDGTLTVSYERDKLAELTPDSTKDSLLSKEEGTATVAPDGTVTAGELSPLVLRILRKGLTLDGERITYTEAGEALEFTVTAENTEAVFGVAIGKDVTAKITLSEQNVKSITLSYTAESGPASIVCEFEY